MKKDRVKNMKNLKWQN